MATSARLLGPIALAGALALAATAHAQGPSPNEAAAARGLAEEGRAASREERWEDALEAYERSYALAPRSGTLLGLARAQAELGRLVLGAESYRRVMEEADGELGRRARRALSALEPRLAHVTVTVDALSEDDQIELDGEPLRHAVLGIRLPVDPGAHRIVLLRDGEQVAGQEPVLAEGESIEVTLEVNVIPEEPPPTSSPLLEAAPPSPADDEGGGALSSPWLWTVVGVVLAGALTVGLVLLLDDGDEPFRGNLGTGGLTFE